MSLLRRDHVTCTPFEFSTIELEDSVDETVVVMVVVDVVGVGGGGDFCRFTGGGDDSVLLLVMVVSLEGTAVKPELSSLLSRFELKLSGALNPEFPFSVDASSAAAVVGSSIAAAFCSSTEELRLFSPCCC